MPVIECRQFGPEMPLPPLSLAPILSAPAAGELPGDVPPACRPVASPEGPPDRLSVALPATGFARSEFAVPARSPVQPGSSGARDYPLLGLRFPRFAAPVRERDILDLPVAS